MSERHIAGVDVGGTFTDFVFLDAAGRLTTRKYPSTPADPSDTVSYGLEAGRNAGEISPNYDLSHGTTVATNALLERRGANTALIMTQGFRDALAIGRQERRELYSLHPSRVAPLLPRDQCYELPERVDWRGETVTPLDESAASRLLDELAVKGVESVAVCFLFSYLNPAHERAVGAMARARGFDVSLSCEIAPEPNEYERANTTTANAFVAPILRNYLSRLETSARDAGAKILRVMQSNGGALSAAEAGAQAVKTALSGPAGGVVAAAALGRTLGLPRLLTFDMGGTSADVALIVNGECPVTTTGKLGGLPLRTPMLAIHTVGAGGGSLARLDAAGGLRVGPQSAGAVPGPVAYGVGEALTVTDANVLLGRLPTAVRLGGKKTLDAARVSRYFEEFASQLRCAPEAAAYGILQVVNAAMARALRHVSTERGHDPADFTLVSFGGAGSLHACELAEALQMRSALIPRFPGAFSALGLALAPIRREWVRSFAATPLDAEAGTWTREFLPALRREFIQGAKRAMLGEGLEPDDWRGTMTLDLRYAGQSFALAVVCPEDAMLPALRAAFHAAHRQRYGHADERETVEAVAARFVAVEASSRAMPLVATPEIPALPFATERVYFESGWQPTPLYYRAAVAADQVIFGPALFLQSDATTLLPPHWRAWADAAGNLRLEMRRSSAARGSGCEQAETCIAGDYDLGIQ